MPLYTHYTNCYRYYKLDSLYKEIELKGLWPGWLTLTVSGWGPYPSSNWCQDHNNCFSPSNYLISFLEFDDKN